MWTLLAAGALLLITDAAQVRQALRETAKLLLIITAAALIGLVVSVIARAPLPEVLRQVVEIHVQAVVGVVISYTLMLRFGLPRVLYAFLIGYGITAVVAVGQALHVELAWNLRERIAVLSNDSIFNMENYNPRERPMGMSYTPVLFATQTCVALAAIFYVRLWQGSYRSPKLDWIVIASSVVLIGLSVITGNRSPMIGIAAFLMIFLVARRPALTGILLPIALVGGGLITMNAQIFEGTGLRVARASNSSSQNRSTLRAYGTYLVERRPIGYGFTFDSTTKWPVFYQQSIYMPNPNSIRNWVLHNYYLQILTKYGLLILFLLPWIIPTRRDHVILWLPFAAYAIHIFYHNDGPLQGDFLVFYTFAAAVLLARQPELFRASLPSARPVPWRRAFAKPLD
jgi:hypothetical protein